PLRFRLFFAFLEKKFGDGLLGRLECGLFDRPRRSLPPNLPLTLSLSSYDRLLEVSSRLIVLSRRSGDRSRPCVPSSRVGLRPREPPIFYQPRLTLLIIVRSVALFSRA